MCKKSHAANFAKISGMGIVALFVLNMQIRRKFIISPVKPKLCKTAYVTNSRILKMLPRKWCGHKKNCVAMAAKRVLEHVDVDV